MRPEPRRGERRASARFSALDPVPGPVPANARLAPRATMMTEPPARGDVGRRFASAESADVVMNALDGARGWPRAEARGADGQSPPIDVPRPRTCLICPGPRLTFTGIFHRLYRSTRHRPYQPTADPKFRNKKMFPEKVNVGQRIFRFRGYQPCWFQPEAAAIKQGVSSIERVG